MTINLRSSKMVLIGLFLASTVSTMAATSASDVSIASENSAKDCGEPLRRFAELFHPGGPKSFTYECNSTDSCFKHCNVAEIIRWPLITDARLVRQNSTAKCIEGQSWGWGGMGIIWVDYGCEATFEVFHR